MKNIPMSSIRQDWRTPRAFYQSLHAEFKFDFDPCPTSPEFDGLKIDWKNRNYINPPFKDIKKWVHKAYLESQKGKMCVLLIPSRTDTYWWHEYVMKANEIRFIQGRIKYEGAKFNAPFPSCVVVFKGSTPTDKKVYEIQKETNHCRG